MTQRTWFITGTSRGFGREWAIAALERGDNVTGTARDTTTMKDLESKYGDRLLSIELDVTNRAADFAAVRQAHERFGGLDIVVNNAGYGQFGMVEELSESELRDQIETNLFGALWITQASLPYLREQGSGHIIQVSSIGGITAFPGIGAYHASKWGLEGISQALAAEVGELGIHVTLIEPGGFSTDWSGPSAKHATQLAAYEPIREAGAKRRGGQQPGDPEASAEALMRIVDAEDPPLRAFFGSAPLGIAQSDYESRLAGWQEWQPVAELAQGKPVASSPPNGYGLGVLTFLVQFGGERFHPGPDSMLEPLLLILAGACVGGLMLPLLRIVITRTRAAVRGWRSRRARVQAAASAERRARVLMSELCPHGWRAQLTLYEGDSSTDNGEPARAPVALDWYELRPGGGEPAVMRRVWAGSVGEALEAMVADRRTDETLEQIELRASADGLAWPDL